MMCSIKHEGLVRPAIRLNFLISKFGTFNSPKRTTPISTRSPFTAQWPYKLYQWFVSILISILHDVNIQNPSSIQYSLLSSIYSTSQRNASYINLVSNSFNFLQLLSDSLTKLCQFQPTKFSIYVDQQFTKPGFNTISFQQ